MLIETIQHHLRERAAIAGSVAGGAIVLALIAMVWSSTAAKSVPPAKAYFVDETTGETVVRNADELPPLANASGQLTVVQAHYYTCGNPPDKWIGYYSKIDPAAKTRVAAELKSANGKASIMGPPASYRESLLIRSPAKDSPWVSASSDQGQKVVATVKCPHGSNHQIFPCPPPSE